MHANACLVPCLVFGTAGLLSISTAAAFPQLTATASPDILHGGAGTTILKLHNSSTAAQSLELAAGPFTNTYSHALLPSAKVTFNGIVANGPVPTSIAPGADAEVLVNVAGDNEAGTSEVELFNHGSPLLSLKAFSYDEPFNVTVDTGQPNATITLDKGQNATITLRNGDDFLYPVKWRFSLPGNDPQSDTLLLPPHQTGRIDVKPPGVYPQTAWFWPRSQTASLLLRLDASPEIPEYLQPWHTVLLTVQLTEHPVTSYSIIRFVLLFLLLALGALCSLLASAILPNVVRRVGLRRQMDGLAARTSSVSTRVDSYLRVLLRLERKRIATLFGSVHWYSTDRNSTFDQIADGLAQLNSRLQAAERLDQLRASFVDVSCDAPPSISDQIDQTLQKAAGALHAFVLQQKDVNAANALLDEATALLLVVNDPVKLATQIAARYNDLQLRQPLFQTAPYASDYDEMALALPGIFGVLGRQYGVAANLTQHMFFGLDHAISALHSVFDYLVIRSNSSDPGIRKRLDEHAPELKRLLGIPAWPALQGARNLVQQMRENVYQQDLLDELARPGQAEIVIDTQAARPNLPIFFSIAFRRNHYNGSAAVVELSCDWTFPPESRTYSSAFILFIIKRLRPAPPGNGNATGDGAAPQKALQEKGWKICHYFTEEGLTQVQAVVSSQSASNTGTTKTRELLVRRGQPRSNPQVFAEVMRFTITLAIALAGLMAGAQQQLEKLDPVSAIVAIFLIGFGADSVKNLLSQPAEKHSA